MKIIMPVVKALFPIDYAIVYPEFVKAAKNDGNLPEELSDIFTMKKIGEDSWKVEFC